MPGRLGPLPNFLIIGAARSGTSTLAAQLAAHPQVYVAHSKEVHFFDRDDHFTRGVDWYREQFAGAGDEALVGDATPTYMTTPETVARMADALPDARLVAILRHPVDRAYSQYLLQHLTLGHDALPFEDAARAYLGGTGEEPVYLRNSRYLRQLEDVCGRYPREALSVVLLDDLRRDPAPVYRGLGEFLGIGDWQPPDVEAVHHARFTYRSQALFSLMRGVRAWKRAPRLARRLDELNRVPLEAERLDPELRAALIADFERDNEALGRWLGRDLSAWNV